MLSKIFPFYQLAPFLVQGIAVACLRLGNLRQIVENKIKMTSSEIKINESTNFKILRILHENPDLTQREIAEKLGISLGSLNYCLKALIDKGFVKMGNFQKSKNKFKYVYLLTPKGFAEKFALTSRFLQSKMEEYEALKIEIETLKIENARVSQSDNRLT